MSTSTRHRAHQRSHQWRPPGWLLAVSLLGAFWPASVLAADVRRGETVTIGPDEIIDEDLYFLVGALLGGWWIGLIALGGYAVALALCFPVVGMCIGRWLLERFGKAGTPLVLALLLGLVLLTLVGRVPVLGALIVLATMLFGLGALVLTAAGGRRMGTRATPQPA